MKKQILALMLSLAIANIIAQEKLLGDWEGKLDIGSKKIKLLIHIKKDSGIIKSSKMGLSNSLKIILNNDSVVMVSGRNMQKLKSLLSF
jgi:hypothetical protein